MSVMTLDVRVSPEKHTQSAMSEKPVRYTVDPIAGEYPFKAEMPVLYVKYRSWAYFAVRGHLSHCELVGEFESDLDLSCTRNTYDMDEWLYGYNDPDCGEYGVAPGPDEYARMSWVCDLLSDFTLNAAHVAKGGTWRISHDEYGSCKVVVI